MNLLSNSSSEQLQPDVLSVAPKTDHYITFHLTSVGMLEFQPCS